MEGNVAWEIQLTWLLVMLLQFFKYEELTPRFHTRRQIIEGETMLLHETKALQGRLVYAQVVQLHLHIQLLLSLQP